MKLRYIVCALAVAVLGAAAVSVLFNRPNQVLESVPVFKCPDSIAVSEDYIYVHDGFFHQILVYDKDMNYCNRITYRNIGDICIYCDEYGRLCRIEDKVNKEYIYNDSFEIEESNKIQQFDRDIYFNRVRHVETEETKYDLNNRFFRRSILTITSNEVSADYYIGNQFHAILQNLSILGFVVLVVYAAYGIAKGMAEELS